MKMTFIDLFCGIGGFRLVLEAFDAKCVFSSEIDKNCIKVYQDNFGDTPHGDIRNIHSKDIPDHDIICAGFPCQPFSQAGLKKGLDDTRGTLFYEIARIAKDKHPKVLLLENVPNLLKHDQGRTFEIIKTTFENLGYILHWKVLKSSDFGLPTMRKRLYIVAFKEDLPRTFIFPEPIQRLMLTMSDVMKGKVTKDVGYTIRVGGRQSGINDRRNWDMYEVDGKVRTLNHKEALIMMGFPTSFKMNVSEVKAMKMIGNTIAMEPAMAIVSKIFKVFRSTARKDKS